MDDLLTTDDFATDDGWDDLIGNPGDELDRIATQEVTRRLRSQDSVTVLDADFGRGELASRLAQLGASVTAMVGSRNPVSKAARSLMESDLGLRFVAADVTDATAPPAGAPFDLIVLRQSLPFLRYQDASRVLARLNGWLKIGGKIMVSAFGRHSHLGDVHPDAEKPVQQRFGTLPEVIAKRYGIEGPICLYSERDLFILVVESGIGVLRSFTTMHGNVKAIGVRI